VLKPSYIWNIHTYIWVIYGLIWIIWENNGEVMGRYGTIHGKTVKSVGKPFAEILDKNREWEWDYHLVMTNIVT